MGVAQKNEYGVFRGKGRKDIWFGQDFPSTIPKGYEIKSGTAEHIFQLNLNSLYPYKELYDPKTQTLLPSKCFMKFKKSKNGIMTIPVSYEDLLKISNHPATSFVCGKMTKLRERAVEIIELCHQYFLDHGLKQDKLGDSYWTPNVVGINIESSNGQLNSHEVLNSTATVFLTYNKDDIWEQPKMPKGYDEVLWNEVCSACNYVEKEIEKHPSVDMADMEKAGGYGVRVFIEELYNPMETKND
jgi:hypothetical protein